MSDYTAAGTAGQGVSRIKINYTALSRKQKKLADYILSHIDSAASMTMHELAAACATSETTVMRFLRKLGYDSYSLFKLDLAKEYAAFSHTADGTGIADGYQAISSSDTAEEIKSKVIRAASTAISGIQTLVDASLIEQAASCLLSAGQILCYGSGGSQVIAMDAFHKFLRLGLPVFCDSNLHLSLVRSNLLSKGDAVILVSHTGESTDLLSCARNARSRGASVIGITSYMNSSLAELSDFVFFSSHTELAYYTDAMVSRLIQLTILDMIYLTVRLHMEGRAEEAIRLSKDAVADLKPPRRL